MPSECVTCVESNHEGFLKRFGKRTILIFLITSCCVQISLSQSENYGLEKVSLTGDMTNFSGSLILQDRDGFMWFGSRFGLYRYDGIGFKYYEQDPFDSISGWYGSINDILEDKDGIIWVATVYGINSFDKKLEQFTRYENLDRISYIADDRKGNIWAGTQLAKICKFNKNTGTYNDYWIPQPATNRVDEGVSIDFIYIDKESTVWAVLGKGGLLKYNCEKDTFEMMPNSPCELKAIFEDGSGRLWITSYCGLFLFDRETELFEKYLDKPGDPNSLKHQMVRTIMEDSSGSLWIRTFDGIYKYSHDLKLLFYWPHSHIYSQSYPYWDISDCLYEDNVGTIWFYSMDGINKLVKELNNFTVYNPDPPKSNYASGIVLENKDSIIFASNGHYYAYNRKTNIFTRNSLFNPHYVYKDTRGVYWFASSVGLHKMIISADQTARYTKYMPDPGDSSSLPGSSIQSIYEDSGERLWIGCWNELPCYYDRENDNFIHLVNNPDSTDMLVKQSSPICQESESGILYAIGNSIYKIIPPFIKVSEHEVMASEVIQCKPAEGSDAGKHRKVYSASYLDKDGSLWLGSRAKGLYHMVEQNMPGLETAYQFNSYSTKNGLAHNQVNSIQKDDQGNLWIGTERGLSRYSPKSNVFTNFFEQDGLPSGSFRLKSTALNSDGEFLYGTRKGIISFYPDSIQFNKKLPPVRITSFKIHNQEVEPGEHSALQKSILFSDEITLSHDQNNLSFEFAALNYIHSDRNQYKYKLESVDKDWVYCGSRNYVNYSSLKPGRYVFTASGSNNDGVWNEDGASLSIMIHPPPWRAWWAYIIYGFILIGIILLYRRYLLSRAQLRAAVEIERLEKEKVEELDHMRSRFFTNISHEFRTPLTLIQGPVEELLKKKSEKVTIKRDELGIIHRNAQRLHMLINQLLDISKLETGKVKLLVSEGQLDKFVRRIVLSFLSLAESRHIKYEYDIPEIPGRMYLDEDKLEKIVTNIISNAFKFTPPGGEITVKLKTKLKEDQDAPEFIEISIKDSGKGIPQDQIDKIFDRFHQVASSDTREYEGTGIGLSLAQELVQIYRGEIKVESELGKGSVFIVVLPVSREQFNENEITLSERGETKGSVIIPEARAEILSHPDSELPVILIVEDNADLRHYISTNLKDGFRILEAQNGREGLTKALEEIPDLILTDLMMPEMDGMDLCNQIRDDQRTDHIPLIMLTAKADKESKLEGLSMGADDYLIKPFDADELRVRVNNLILQRRKLRERYRREFLKNDPFTKEIPNLEDDFLTRVLDCIKEHLDDTDFSVELLGSEIGFSRSQLYRKILSLTGFVPSELIRNLRLKQAARMFQEGHSNITRVLYTVGFNSPSHFSRQFHSYFGMNPSEYIKQHRASSK